MKKKSKTTLQDYHDFLNEVLVDLMSGKDPKQKIATKVEKLANKLSYLSKLSSDNNDRIKIINNNVVI